ncbi:conjugal transfer protein TraI [Longitalea luteola]|uniref:conjugal transfer protein TraI n=1 Tax=Longitalea luteola TaxID=2812563 RepID=UPI001A966FC7|nr:conjugal transfer protein TraI [Longitalea luteola]
MKKKLCVVILCGLMLTVIPIQSSAQDPIMEVIKAAVVKAIKAMDLQIQRLQNATIWLQNAQKTVENTMSKLKLDEISYWVQKQKDLYDNYFDELWRVKSTLATYYKVKEIIEMQAQIVTNYKTAYALFRQDKNFTPEEIDRMYQMYSAILQSSLKNLDQVYLVINSFATQMTDAKRREIINRAAENIALNKRDLDQYNEQNKFVSIQRASAKGEIEVVKKLYGLQ